MTYQQIDYDTYNQNIIMFQSSHVLQQQTVQIKKAKTQLAVTVARLNEQVCLRSHLQHKLFDLTNHIKQLKSQQYRLHKSNVESQLAKVKLIKNIQRTRQDLTIGTVVVNQIQGDVDDACNSIKNVEQDIRELLQLGRCLEQRNQENVAINKKQQLKIFGISQQSQKYEGLIASKQQLIFKLKESVLYYQNQLEGLRINIQKSKEKLATQDLTRKSMLSQIKEYQLRQSCLAQQQKRLERETIEDNSMLESESMKNKVLKQKLYIMKERQAIIESKWKEASLVKKNKQGKVIQVNKNIRNFENSWKMLAPEIKMKIEYSKHYCQRVKQSLIA